MELSLMIYCLFLLCRGCHRQQRDWRVWRRNESIIDCSHFTGRDSCVELMVLVSASDSSTEPPPNSGHWYDHRECVGTHFNGWKGMICPIPIFNSQWAVFYTGGGSDIVWTQRSKLHWWSGSRWLKQYGLTVWWVMNESVLFGGDWTYCHRR